jgi:hypothetical protein
MSDAGRVLDQIGTVLTTIRHNHISKCAPQEKAGGCIPTLEENTHALLICLDEKEMRVHQRSGGVLYLDKPEGVETQIWNHKALKKLPVAAKYLIVPDLKTNLTETADLLRTHRHWAAVELNRKLVHPNHFDPFDL